jgi:hypothetical protein
MYMCAVLQAHKVLEAAQQTRCRAQLAVTAEYRHDITVVSTEATPWLTE